MLELDNESKILKNYWWLNKCVLGCLLGLIDGKFAIIVASHTETCARSRSNHKNDTVLASSPGFFIRLVLLRSRHGDG